MSKNIKDGIIPYYFALLKKEKIADLKRMLIMYKNGWKALELIGMDGIIQRVIDSSFPIRDAIRQFKSKLSREDLALSNVFIIGMVLKKTEHRQINTTLPMWQALLLDKVKMRGGKKSHVIQVALNDLFNKIGRDDKDIIKYVGNQMWTDSPIYDEDWSGNWQKIRDEQKAKKLDKEAKKRAKKPIPKIEPEAHPEYREVLEEPIDSLPKDLEKAVKDAGFEWNQEGIDDYISSLEGKTPKNKKKTTKKKKKKTFEEEFPTSPVNHIIDEVMKEEEESKEDNIPGLDWTKDV